MPFHVCDSVDQWARKISNKTNTHKQFENVKRAQIWPFLFASFAFGIAVSLVSSTDFLAHIF